MAVRRLVASDGTAIEAEAPFAALRDRRPTDIPQLVERRQRFERIFRRLARAGIDRDELVLAFDFTVQSDHQLTHQMLTMRDTALAWLAAQTQPTFTVDSVEEFDCSQPGQAIWKEIAGTYQSPLFLEALPVATNAPQHTVDGNDDPVMNGVMNPPYDLSIPCLAHPEFGDAEAEIHMLLLGHGIFGTGKQMVEGIPPAAALVMDHFEGAPAPDGGTRTTRRWNYIAGATNWTGWSGFADGARDGLWIAGQIIGFGPTSALENFPALPDRHRQGQLNTLVLSRLMKTGAFNAHPAFQSADGSGLLPTTAEQYYYGISMGGVQGLFQAALSQDIEKFGIDVGSMNFSFLLQRSTQFPIFDALLTNIGLSDPLDQLVGLGLLHELWVSADPAGYITHVTDPENLLPGNEFAKKIYLSPAWLDYQVSNHGTEATARTLGVASGPGSVQKELAAIPDAPSGTPLDSALIVWDTGLHDLLDPAGQASIPRSPTWSCRNRPTTRTAPGPSYRRACRRCSSGPSPAAPSATSATTMGSAMLRSRGSAGSASTVRARSSRAVPSRSGQSREDPMSPIRWPLALDAFLVVLPLVLPGRRVDGAAARAALSGCAARSAPDRAVRARS
ncbi:MAG: hypothetical protein M5U32_00940 [Myxococcota bacterium]|nr:hypothetical protein [Myxococcota bacterium]